jgi:hypothetical protein
MSNAVRAAATTDSKEERARQAITALYGDEETLIVVNTTRGVVPIGFQPQDGRGHEIPRGRAPIVLTNLAPREAWLRSTDFRSAVSKQWLRVVPPTEYEAYVARAAERERELQRLAAQDAGRQVKPAQEAVRRPVDEEIDGQDEEMDIDPETSSIVPASEVTNSESVRMTAEQIRQGLHEYDRTGGVSAAPPDPASPTEGRAARAESLCERIAQGMIQPIDAIAELDGDAELYSADDLAYIVRHAKFVGVKSLAQQLLSKKES